MDESVERQLTILDELINAYRLGQLPLNTLVQRIEGVSEFIRLSWWKDKLFPILLHIEQINAANVETDSRLSETDKADVTSALKELSLLISRARET